MGTNYYIKVDICKSCKRFTEIHIGKSSHGWRFNVEIHEGYYNSEKSFLSFIERKDIEIRDEYGRKITTNYIKALIKAKKNDKAHSKGYPDNCKSDGDVELNYGEFS